MAKMDLKTTNFCVSGIISICGAGKTWAKQRYCQYSVRSDIANKCMYYNQYIDGHCDCIDAQKAAELKLEDLYEDESER